MKRFAFDFGNHSDMDLPSRLKHKYSLKIPYSHYDSKLIEKPYHFLFLVIFPFSFLFTNKNHTKRRMRHSASSTSEQCSFIQAPAGETTRYFFVTTQEAFAQCR